MQYEKKLNDVLVAIIISDTIDYTKQGYRLVNTEQIEKTSELETINKRINFIEDCIAEMAEVVYNTEETT